jgi:hypothetical protein
MFESHSRLCGLRVLAARSPHLAPAAGEEPCDEVDRCCMKHDACVDKSGVLAERCHKSFVRCMERQVKKQSNGFSKKVTHGSLFRCLGTCGLLPAPRCWRVQPRQLLASAPGSLPVLPNTPLEDLWRPPPASAPGS